MSPRKLSYYFRFRSDIMVINIFVIITFIVVVECSTESRLVEYTQCFKLGVSLRYFIYDNYRRKLLVLWVSTISVRLTFGGRIHDKIRKRVLDEVFCHFLPYFNLGLIDRIPFLNSRTGKPNFFFFSFELKKFDSSSFNYNLPDKRTDVSL